MALTPLQTPDDRVQRTPDAITRGDTAAGAGVPRFAEGTPSPGPDAGAGPGPVDAGGSPGGAGVDAAPPAAPDACSTEEEEARKERFRARSFSALDFRPSAGYGKFDAYYWPASALMAAIVKMKFNYVQADNTPSVPTLFAMWRAGQDIQRFFWTDAEKTQFAEDYRRRIIDRWSFVHTFRSTKPCWPFSAQPFVTPWVVEDASDAHFEVTVHKSAGPGIDYSSGFRARNPGTAGWRGTGDLYSSDVRESANFNSVDVATSERQRLDRAIAAALASPILFEKDRSELRAPYDERLATLAEALNAKNPSDPPIPIVITGFASAEGDATHNQELSEARAEAVALALRRAGVPQPLVVSGRGPVGTPDDAANRKVEIATDTSFEDSYASNRYSVAEHEFGHTLGLPDEYNNITTGDLGAKQSAFVALAVAAGVDPPDQWGDTTSSQMSAGVDVLPRHYLTLWEALGQMTSPDITRNEWSIG